MNSWQRYVILIMRPMTTLPSLATGSSLTILRQNSDCRARYDAMKSSTPNIPMFEMRKCHLSIPLSRAVPFLAKSTSSGVLRQFVVRQGLAFLSSPALPRHRQGRSPLQHYIVMPARCFICQRQLEQGTFAGRGGMLL